MDTVANMLTSVRNAQAVKKTSVVVVYSKLKYDIAKILERRGYIAGAEKKIRKIKKNGTSRSYLEMTLKYINDVPLIAGCRKISKPGQRVYVSAAEINKVKQGRGIGIISTSKGLMTERDAKKQNIGGEVICEVW